MRSKKKGFTLIELLIVVVIVGILALAAIPLITANTRDARRAEGEQLLGSMKNRVRVAYTKTQALPSSLTGEMTAGGAGVEPGELTGAYFAMADTVTGALDGAIISCTPVATGSTDGTGTLTFFVAGTGSSANDTIVWS